MKAIDLHTHYNHGAADDHQTSLIYRADLPFLETMYQHANIACGVFSSFASMNNRLTVQEENEHVFRMTQQYPWVWQWVVIDPRQEQTFEQADRILRSEKCLGIKMHPLCHGYDTADYADRIFSFANERKTVVLTHPDPPELIERIVPFADRYPDMKLILAHLGSMEHICAMEKAKHQNIYTDTSGYASITNHLLEYAVERVGAEKIFFGTDTYASASQRGRIEFAMIRDTDKEKILRDNALAVFPKLRAVSESLGL